jgi:hypothetical protein
MVRPAFSGDFARQTKALGAILRKRPKVLKKTKISV